MRCQGFSRIWTDPTDLVMLGVLPVGLWLLKAFPAAPRVPERVVLAGGVALSAVACLASSLEDAWAPVIGNRTFYELAVVVRRYAPPLDCDDLANGSVEYRAGDFRAAEILVVPSGHVRTLREEGATEQSDPQDPQCGAALLDGEGLDPILLTWQVDSNSRVKPITDDEDVAPEGALYLEPFGDDLLIAPGPGMAVEWWSGALP